MLKMKSLIFSVIVPVYNAAQYLNDCIISVLRQTKKNWELILVDDGSKDNSLEICNKYATEYSNIKVFHKSNSGQYETREFGVKKSSGDYCIFLDADDMLLQSYIECVMKYIRIYNSDCIVCGLERITNSGAIDNWKDDSVSCLTDKKDQFKKLLLNPVYNSLCRKIVKRALLLEAMQGEHIIVKHGEDLIQSIAIFENARDILFIPDVLYQYRINNESVTHRYDLSAFLQDTISVQEYIYAFLGKRDYFTDDEYQQLSDKFTINLVDIVREISARSNRESILENYNIIKESNIFNEFICKYPHKFSQLGIKVVIYQLFCRNRYREISFIGLTNKIIKSIIHRV